MTDKERTIMFMTAGYCIGDLLTKLMLILIKIIVLRG